MVRCCSCATAAASTRSISSGPRRGGGAHAGRRRGPCRRMALECTLGGMKPPHTFRGVVVKSDPAVRLKALAPKATPGPARVRVGPETFRRSGKGVSVITGLPLSVADMETLATRLKKLCGAGGAVRDGAIEIQGEHRDR